MSQISYDILDVLSKQDIHIRGIAKKLGTNQMTVSRKVKELEESNILDFRIEGRNKVYFLKGSLESKESLFCLEHQKVIGAIRRYPRLRRIVEEIKKSSHIRLAILFGSYAKHAAGKDSDIDLFLDTDKETRDNFASIDSLLSIQSGRFNKDSPLAREIIKDHIILKGVEEFYETIKKDQG